MIEQVGGALGHPAPAATRTDRAALTGKRDQPVEGAVVAVKPREPTGKPATLQKVPELPLHEAGQAFLVAQAAGVRPEGLEMIVHDLYRADPAFRIYDLRATYATRLSAGGIADEWVTQLLRQGDAQVFKRYSQMKLQMKREALQKLNRSANEGGLLRQSGEFCDSRGPKTDQSNGGAYQKRSRIGVILDVGA